MSPAGTPGIDVNESAVSDVFAASIASIIISSAFFAGRIISKRLQRASFDASDYALLGGLAGTWGLSVADMWMTSVGLGKHFAFVQKADPSLSGVKLMLKTVMVDEILYDVGISSIKVSILLLYRSLFLGSKFVIATKTLMGVVIAWFFVNLLCSIFSCRPVSGFWDITMSPPPICLDRTVLYVVGSTVNISTDFAILTLPITQITKLQMRRRTKIALIFVFLLGGVVCVVSIYRFFVLLKASYSDLTWGFANVLNWTAAELATAVAAACLPVMQPLAKALVSNKWITSTTARTHTRREESSSSQVATKHKSYGPGRSERRSHFGPISEFERLPETVSTAAESEWPERPVVRDIEHGYGTDEGILVTKTFEMRELGRDARGDEDRS
ncbi:MAG: hypothetical protein M1820_005212 [Bogoriella megaspora]|nr:MAG: hypothetical protein M1820_005212 [Bogoriella megaspora]